jgi:iron complex transport system permease protein
MLDQLSQRNKLPIGSNLPASGKLALGIGALTISFLLALAFGSVTLPLEDSLRVLFMPGLEITQVPQQLRRVYSIIWFIRLPRAVISVFAGAALATSGAAIQGLFRNPLASPDVLGISAGSSLGAVLAIVTGISAVHPLAISGAAFVGAITAAFIVYGISMGPGGTHLLYLVLAGLAVSSFLSGLVSGILVIAEEYALTQFIFWTMGGLEGASWLRALPPIPFILVLLVVLFFLSEPLNVLSLGEEQAFSLGVSVELVKLVILTCSATLTAFAVALAGPIAFIGLMVPHGVRLIVGPNHKMLLPFSALVGSIFLLLADLIARTILAPGEIKTGIITALIGGPYFLFLILRHRKEGVL